MKKNRSNCVNNIPDFTTRWSKIKRIIRTSLPQPVKNLYRIFVPRSMKEAFTEVYRCDDWQGGSGHDSTPDTTREYRELIEHFLLTHNIKRVVDIGCGDWQFSQLINWGDVEYLGIDTVQEVVEENRRRFGQRYKFECLDMTHEALPPGDLLLMKDVLQHWPNCEIIKFLPRIEQYQYGILTNDCYPSSILNTDITMTGYRPLDLRLPPFSLVAEEILRYGTYSNQPELLNKLVLLH